MYNHRSNCPCNTDPEQLIDTFIISAVNVDANAEIIALIDVFSLAQELEDAIEIKLYYCTIVYRDYNLFVQAFVDLC